MNSKKFLSLIILGSLFCNQFSLCMFNCCKNGKNKEKTYRLKDIVIENNNEEKNEKKEMFPLGVIRYHVLPHFSCQKNMLQNFRLVSKDCKEIVDDFVMKLNPDNLTYNKLLWFKSPIFDDTKITDVIKDIKKRMKETSVVPLLYKKDNRTMFVRLHKDNLKDELGKIVKHKAGDYRVFLRGLKKLKGNTRVLYLLSSLLQIYHSVLYALYLFLFTNVARRSTYSLISYTYSFFCFLYALIVIFHLGAILTDADEKKVEKEIERVQKLIHEEHEEERAEEETINKLEN
ncbi:hypothetical protein ACFLYA_01715 [Candidatus Dependentiae bacterium]